MDNKTTFSPRIIEAMEFCENTIESLRLMLVQKEEDSFFILLEGLESPSFKEYKQILPTKLIIGKDRAYLEYNFLAHQLKTAYFE